MMGVERENVKEYKLRQDIPILEVQQFEALEKGVVLLCKTENRCYGQYKLSCGHYSFLHYGAVRKSPTGKFFCKECLDIKLQKEADKFNLVYNKNIKSKGSDWRNYTFPCGHSRDIKTANIRFSAVACSECTEEKYNRESLTVGLVLLDSKRNDGKRLYLLPCGHKKSISLASVRDNSFTCRECQDIRYAQQAEKSGVVYHKGIKSSHHDYRVYTLSCGCTKEVAIACVKNGTFECKVHSERFIDYSTPISVYLAKFTLPIGEYLKVGFAMDVNSRMKRYGVNGEVSLLTYKQFQNGEEALKFEKHLHSKYKDLSSDKEQMRMHMENGFTECYPMELYNELYESITNK